MSFQNTKDFLEFLWAGHAIFTVVSKRTGVRFTYKAKPAKACDLLWVSVLRGPDNTSDYLFLGGLKKDGTYLHSHKAQVNEEAPSASAVAWLFRHLQDPELLNKIEIHHAGRCGRCGRLLTTPESIATGLGPVCAGAL